MMNIRRIDVVGTVGLLLSAVLVAGCAPSGPDPASPVSDGSVTSSGAESGDIVLVMNSDPSLKEDYATIRELAGSKNVVAIIRGTVSSTRDVYLEMFAHRILSVKVTEVLRGEVGKKQVTVLEDGGVVPYARVLPDIPAKDAAPAPPADPSGLVDFTFMGARHTEAGDDVVLFLGVNPNSGTAIDTEYFIVSSVRGRFTLDTETNTFVRAAGEGTEKEARPGSVNSADLKTLKREIAAAPR
jgi:hypothetical protein